MSQLPIGLRPAMGYALWHLQHGQSPADVAAQLASDRRYSAYTPEQRRQILNEAQVNLAVTARAQLATDRVEIGTSLNVITPEGIRVAVPADMVFGVRVLFAASTPHDANANVSVVINVRAGTSIEAIKARAREFALEGEMQAATGHASPGLTLGAAAIAQVVIGGYAGASIQM